MIASREDRTVVVQVAVYGSSKGLATARNAYDTGVPADCRCKGYTMTTQAVTGVGDQATAVFTTYDQPAAQNAPVVSLLLRSGNAIISLGYTVFPIVSAARPPANASLLAADIAMARDVPARLPA
jgi:hypothetical protein